MSEEYDNGYSHGYDEGLAECEEARKENTRLRADLAAVTAERDRMREVIKSINAMLEIFCETLERPTYDSLEVGQRHNPLSQKEIIQRLTETCSFVRADLLKTIDEARAALEGVPEPASHKGPVEQLNLRNAD